MTGADPVLRDRRRDEFPSLASGTLLLSHSLGPIPRAAEQRMGEYLRRWRDHASEDAWAASWWTLSDEVGDGIARVLGAAPGTVQPLPSATLAMATAASCIDLAGPRPKVVTSALDFPSMAYFWDAQRRLGAEIEVVPSPDGIRLPMDALLEAIDERTALVAVSHASYRSSFLVDAPALVERAHAVGARVLLDVYQTAGALEIEAAGWSVDFLIGGTIKWLCGGPATGYLYVRPDLHDELEPRLTGWIAHADPFAFAPAPQRYARGARRFAQGTPPIPALHSALAGLEIVGEVGVPAIAAESRRRTAWMVDFARERGLVLNSPPDAAERGASVMIGVERPAETVAHLAERRIFVDWRPDVGLRISPHFFNTDDEVHAAMDVVAELAT